MTFVAVREINRPQNAAVEREETQSPGYFDRIPDYVIQIILTNLNPTGISRLGRTCKKFNILVRDDRIWKKWVSVDFNKKNASKVQEGNHREAYAEKYRNIKAFLMGEPHIDTLLYDLKGDLLGGSSQNFRHYVDHLTDEEQDHLFVGCSERGYLPLVTALLNHPRFQAAKERNRTLISAFTLAAKMGHLHIFRAIMQNQGFAELGEETLKRAFDLAVTEDDFDIVSEIINSKGTVQIDEIVLALGFCSAAMEGKIEIVRAFIQSSRFAKIAFFQDVNFIGTALFAAIAAEQIEIVEAIMQCKEFSEIEVNSEKGLSAAFDLAVMYNHIAIVRFFIQCDRFIEQIEPTFLKQALRRAMKKGQSEVIAIITQHPKLLQKLTTVNDELEESSEDEDLALPFKKQRNCK